jgi:hypothetical protein
VVEESDEEMEKEESQGEPEVEEEEEIIESDVELEGETVEPDNDPPQKVFFFLRIIIRRGVFCCILVFLISICCGCFV